MKEIRIDPDVVHCIEIPLEEIVEKLLILKRYGKRKGVIVTGFWERPIENLFSSILEERTAFCGGIRGNSFVVNSLGDILMCAYSTKKLGSTLAFDIDDFFKKEGEYHQLITSRLVGRIPGCINCPIEGQCVGGCYVAEEYEQKEKSGVIERNCELYQIMTKELLQEKLSEQE